MATARLLEALKQATAGLRLGEASALNIDDFDITELVFRVKGKGGRNLVRQAVSLSKPRLAYVVDAQTVSIQLQYRQARSRPLHLIKKNGARKDMWRSFLFGLDNNKGQQALNGFVRALHDCSISHRGTSIVRVRCGSPDKTDEIVRRQSLERVVCCREFVFATHTMRFQYSEVALRRCQK